MDLQPLKIDRDPPKRSRRKNRWIGPLVFLALLAGLFFLFQRPILAFVDGWRLPEVRVAKVQKRSGMQAAAVSGTSANGYVVAKTRAALSADTPGRIVELNVQEGSVVKKGDVVARLYSTEYAAAERRAEAELLLAEEGRAHAEGDVQVSQRELDQARANLRSSEASLGEAHTAQDLAKLDLARSKHLLDAGVGNQERYDRDANALESAKARILSGEALVDAAKQGVGTAESRVEVAKTAVKEAEARVKSAQAARDLAKATLEKTEVRAPFDGIVVLKDAEVGEVVSPNVQGGSTARGSVVTMVDFATLEVQAEVPETSLAAVKLGADAQIFLDAYPEKPYRGRVDRIWPTANRAKATVEVRVVFLERDDRLRPEMGVRIVFVDHAPQAEAKLEDAAPVIVIPNEAVVRIANEPNVFVLERDVVHLRKVQLGELKSGKVVVQSGLAEGESIVLGPPNELKDGARVRVQG